MVIHLLLIVVGNICKVFPSVSVNRIRESWMICIKLRSIRKNLICKLIKVSYTARKPRNGI